MDGGATTNGQAGCKEQLILDPAGLRLCLARICSWRVPPNWERAAWFEEISAVVHSAACEAELAFDSTRGVALAAFISSRALARALTRYRQEWNFSHRCVCSNLQEEENIRDHDLQLSASPPKEAHESEALMEALARLDAPKRFVIEQLFWMDRTQAEIGLELGISQRAVSKRRSSALRALTAHFFQQDRQRGSKM